jgi:hypothetical protein
MNERIKTLAKQADVFEYKNYIDPYPRSIVLNTNEVIKFAELIIQECVNIATYPELNDEESYYGKKFAEAIQKHFGVKG